MPFPLAHPAAVLPLRRYCPQRLSFPALAIGSLTPDASYCLGEKEGGAFGHSLLGSVVFCLPVGILLLALFYGLRAPVVRMLPAPYPQAFLPLCRGHWLTLGGGHFLVDRGLDAHPMGFIHPHQRMVRATSARSPIGVVISVRGRTARVCHLLWYGCSFAGVIWLFLAFEKWKQPPSAGAPGLLARRCCGTRSWWPF